MGATDIRELRRRLVADGPAALAGLVPANADGGPLAIEAAAYECLADGQPAAAFVRLREAERAFADSPEEAAECLRAAISLFAAEFPPYQSEHEAFADVADWLLLRLRALDGLATARRQGAGRAASSVEERHVSDEFRHRWMFRLAAGRTDGRRYALDALCGRLGLDARDHFWLTTLLAAGRDRAVSDLAQALGGVRGASAGLWADAISESPEDAASLLRRLGSDQPLRTFHLVGLASPWPNAPLRARALQLDDSVEAWVDGRSAWPDQLNGVELESDAPDPATQGILLRERRLRAPPIT